MANNSAERVRLLRVAIAATVIGPMNSIVTAMPRSTRAMPR